MSSSPSRKRQRVPPKERDSTDLFVLTETLRCAHSGCVPCVYKLALQWDRQSGPALQPNVRPELCPRHPQPGATRGAGVAAGGGAGGGGAKPVGGVRRAGLYSSAMHILTVGDGDLSFSLALAKALWPRCVGGGQQQWGAGSLTATLYESRESLLRVYPAAEETLAELAAHGVQVWMLLLLVVVVVLVVRYCWCWCSWCSSCSCSSCSWCSSCSSLRR